MPFLEAVLVILVLVALGIALQWLPVGMPGLLGIRGRYQYAYIVLLVQEKPDYAGCESLAESVRLIEPGDLVDSFFLAGTPALHAWFAARDARDYFRDSEEIQEPPWRHQTDVRLLVYAGCVSGLSLEGGTDGLRLLRQIAGLPQQKHALHLLRWLPELSNPAVSWQEGAEWFGRLLAKTI